MSLSRHVVAALVFAILAWSPEAIAGQLSSGGAIRGYVKDEQRAIVQGATVTATSPTVAGMYRAATDAEGYYRLLDLPPGVYTLAVEAPGFASFLRPDLDVRVGLNLLVDVILRVGSVADTVVVTLETPMIESVTAATAVNVSGEFQRETPLSLRRDWAQFLEVTPGVTATQTASAPTYSFHGSTASSHVLQVDGADIGSAQSGANLMLNFSSAAVQDVRIATGSAEPSAPLGVGAVVSLVTPSGTNRFRATADYVHQGRSWNSTNNPGGVSAQANLRQSDLSLGGPIARDRATFFVAYRHENSGVAVARSQAQLSALRSIVPAFEPFRNETEGNYSFIKVSATPSTNHRVSVSYQQDRSPTSTAVATHADVFNDLETGGPAWTAALFSSLGRSTTARVTAAYNEKSIKETVRNLSVPSRPVYQRVLPGTGGSLAGNNLLGVLDSNGAERSSPYSKLVFAADITHYSTALFGAHEVKLGTYLSPHAQGETILTYPAGGLQTEEHVLRDPANPAAGTVPFHRFFGPSSPLTTSSTRAHDYALYMQDTWSPHARVSAMGGVRVDWTQRHDEIFDRQIQDSTQVGPRVGLRFALTDRGDTALRASWGIIHEAVSSTLNFSFGSVTAERRDTYDTNLDGVFETTLVQPGSSILRPDRIFDEEFRQGYVREFIVGASHQFPGRIAVDASWMRRNYLDLPTVVETNGIYEGGVFRGFRDNTRGQVGLITNNSWNSLVYSGLVLQASMRRARHQLLGSYGRQWRHVSGTWQPNDPVSFIQPDVFANDKALEGGAGSGSAIGIFDSYTAPPGTQWRDHTVRIAGTTDLGWGFTVGSNLTIESGRWSGPITTTVPVDTRFGPPTVTLATGAVVSNPLSTPTRFAFPTRGEGQLEAPTLIIWSIRGTKSIRVAGHQFAIGGSVFNVTNEDADQSFQSRSIVNPQFGLGSVRQLPRAAQATMSWAF